MPTVPNLVERLPRSQPGVYLLIASRPAAGAL